jgi:WASH complex subunit strumpellin
MCELIYYYGVMLLLLDWKIEGPVRERLLVSYYRYKGHSTIADIDDVCNLCRNTGFSLGKKRPANYPDEYFARFPMQINIVNMIILHLKDDDIYQQILAYPNPEHRTTALAN